MPHIHIYIYIFYIFSYRLTPHFMELFHCCFMFVFCGYTFSHTAGNILLLSGHRSNCYEQWQCITMSDDSSKTFNKTRKINDHTVSHFVIIILSRECNHGLQMQSSPWNILKQCLTFPCYRGQKVQTEKCGWIFDVQTPHSQVTLRTDPPRMLGKGSSGSKGTWNTAEQGMLGLRGSLGILWR